MDTTLRDGEQTSGVSFSAAEKLTIAQLLLQEVKVDRIEIASARVSEGELLAVQKITEWANTNGFIDKIEVLTFVDGESSINWMLQSGAKVMNLLTKGSLNHLTYQLKKTPEEHFNEIKNVIQLALSKGIKSNVRRSIDKGSHESAPVITLPRSMIFIGRPESVIMDSLAEIPNRYSTVVQRSAGVHSFAVGC